MVYPPHMHLVSSGATPAKQRGATLIVALVMLVLLTLISLSAMNSTTTSIQVVGNAQFREEANAAAQQAIEKRISSDDSTTGVEVVTLGAATYNATVSSTCLNSIQLTTADKDKLIADAKAARLAASAAVAAASTADEIAAAATAVVVADDFYDGAMQCSNQSGAAIETGIMNASGVLGTSGGSLCNKENRDFKAEVDDENTGAKTVVHQGIYSIVPSAGSVCP